MHALSALRVCFLCKLHVLGAQQSAILGAQLSAILRARAMRVTPVSLLGKNTVICLVSGQTEFDLDKQDPPKGAPVILFDGDKYTPNQEELP